MRITSVRVYSMGRAGDEVVRFYQRLAKPRVNAQAALVRVITHFYWPLYPQHTITFTVRCH